MPTKEACNLGRILLWSSFMSPQDLLLHVETAIATSGLSPSRFGFEAVGDPAFVFDLREGREPRQKTIGKVLKFIAQQQRAN